MPLSQIQIGELFQQLVSGAARHNVRMPTDFTMMFEAILTTKVWPVRSGSSRRRSVI